ncbi:hypothetical protein D7Z54_17290 [Salibacterium salarium]|uniref:Uncharacterized protein n=1 Tax=Salibacterium salarium TaxID=284579 RepID=A0A428N1I9_9BACI|nr:hypothetical protein [Salibacterium salarium]RSL32179.1 hypothetical protein D7Z54_17290 [Salibacterium salarium]
MSHLRELADIEAFIREEPDPFSQEKAVTQHNVRTEAEQEGARENSKETLVLYYLEEDNLLKFKKS